MISSKANISSQGAFNHCLLFGRCENASQVLKTSQNHGLVRLQLCITSFFAASPITSDISLIAEHSVERENITWVLFSAMYCARFF